MSRQDTKSNWWATGEQLIGQHWESLLQHHQNNLQISSNAHNSQTLTIQKILKCASSIDCPVECKFNWLSSNFQRGSISLQFSFRGFSTLQFIVCTCRYSGVYLGTWVLGCLGMYLRYSGMYLGTWVLGCLGMYLGCCRSYYVTKWLPPNLPYFKCHTTENTLTFSNTHPS